MYRLIQIENKEGFSDIFLDKIKQYKNIKVKKISNTLIELKSITFTQELIYEIKKLNYDITYDYQLYESEDIDLFDFYYCSGQEIPDTTIELSKEVDSNLERFFDIKNYCPKCKLGLIQDKPLSFKGNLQKICKKNFLTPFWSFWLISKELKNKLEKANLTGINYLPVYNAKNEIYNDVYQIKPISILYNSDIVDCLKPRIKYTKCNCNNYTYIFKNLNGICMRKEIKNDLQDFTELFERTERKKGIYILCKKFIKELIKNEVYPDKHYQIWPINFV